MLTWSNIDTVMFDMDGTVLDLHFDNYFWLTLIPSVYGQKHDMDTEQAAAVIRSKYADQLGSLNWYCMDFWSTSLDIDIATLKEEARHRIAVRPFAVELLQELRQQEKKLLLVTNAHPHSLALKMRHTGIAQHFHNTISSHDLGLAKEQAGFWTSLREIEQYDPQRTLLIDDNLSVLRCARDEGISHLLAIQQPDSQQAPLQAQEFVQIEDFRHIFPQRPVTLAGEKTT